MRILALLALGFFVVAAIGVVGFISVTHMRLQGVVKEKIALWKSDPNWKGSGEHPKQFVDALIAIEEPDFFSREDCLSLSEQVATMLKLSRNEDSFSKVRRAGLTVQVARILQWELPRTKMSRWHLDQSLLIDIADCSISKADVLSIYLNRIYVGKSDETEFYGFTAGSELYFQKPFGQLSLSQQALLIGIPQSPARYDPRTQIENAITRRRTVLERISLAGLITEDQEVEANKAGILE